MTITHSEFWKQTVSLTAMVALIGFFSFSLLEPETVGAASASDNVTVSLTVDEEISITDGANATLNPNLGLSSDTSTGSSTWNVKTNSNAGYTLAVKASTSPAMHHQTTNDTFVDYTESTDGTPDDWSVDSGTHQFGFSARGTDVETEYDPDTDGTGSCGGSGDPGNTNYEYEGFTTSDESIASRATTTPVTGIDSTICFGVEQNQEFAPSGDYQATIVATATTN